MGAKLIPVSNALSLGNYLFALGDAAAGGLDSRAGALGRQHARELHRFVDLAGLDHFHRLRARMDESCRLERQKIDIRDRHLRKVGQPHLGGLAVRARLESTLGQAALKRHLTAFEADLVKPARARFLAFMAASRGLAQSRPDAPADTALGLLASSRGLDGIQSHHRVLQRFASATRSMYPILLIMPRVSGVSCSSTVWLRHLRPSPRTVSRWSGFL